MSDTPPKKVAQKWVRNKSDELAYANGCRFDEKRGEFVCQWIEEHCHLYEGALAGEKIKLTPWQKDVVMRVFSWVEWSDHWNRWIRRFSRASIWISKKNGKTPFIAAVGLYLLCGDGEHGQKVYCAAFDGGQAALSWAHAKNMVKHSPQLDPERGGLCEINLTDKRITYKPTLSEMIVIAGDNKKTQEGRNGSVIVDEVHVCTAELMAILKGAGINRSEPLQFEASTAGNNPHGYGKKQYDYGKRVERGETINQKFFFAAWESPASVPITDKNFMECGEKANPSWKILINPDEFRDSYFEAKQSITDFNNFKMYRLGQWQRAANPWLRDEDWLDCVSQMSWRDTFRMARGLQAYGGLDKGQRNDITSFTVTIPINWRGTPKFIQWTWLWLCRASAERIAKNVDDFPDWIARKFIKIAGNATVDDDIVIQDICRLGKFFRICEVGYDRMYAETLMQYVSNGLYRNGQTIIEGLGCNAVEFLQTFPSYALPTTNYEKALLDKSLIIVDNPCLTWMASHCEVRQDGNGNRKPEKPEGEDHRKIDGIVSSIMSLARAQARMLVRPTISSF